MSQSPLPAAALQLLGTRYLAGDGLQWRQTHEKYAEATLYEDPARGERTLLMRMDPGARFALHAHDGEREQIYVLSGSFWDDRQTLRPGDYACREPGDPHEAGSDEGCVALLIYSPG